MRPLTSAYYPPRASAGGRWLALAKRSRVFGLLRMAPTKGFSIIAGLLPAPVWQIALSVLLPGYGFRVAGQKRLARMVLWVVPALILAFVAFAGSVVSDAAVALLLCLHGTSLCYLLEPCLSRVRLLQRMVFSIVIIAGLAILLYSPIRNFIGNHLFCPVRVGDKVLVVRHISNVQSLRHGDVIAYRMDGGQASGRNDANGYNVALRIQEGVGMGPVIAKQGDRVEFYQDHYCVNGIKHGKMPFMPRTGRLDVGRKCLFIWPQLRHSGINLPAGVDAVLMRLGHVSDDQVMGRAPRHWFWRRQSI